MLAASSVRSFSSLRRMGFYQSESCLQARFRNVQWVKTLIASGGFHSCVSGTVRDKLRIAQFNQLPKPMSQLILITGANRGIGLALTKELLSKKHHVIATARDPDGSKDLQELRAVHGAAISVVQLDVTSDDSVARTVEAVRASFGKLDVLVNNAGLFPEEGNEKLTE